jgi:hypothetical protein
MRNPLSGRGLASLLPGVALMTSACVLFTRAGYGPLADHAHRGEPCTASRCPHNASILAILGFFA